MKTNDWPALLLGLFDRLQDRLPRAMEAAGCREGWLQAEMMMLAAEANVKLWPNTEPVLLEGKRQSGLYDLAAYDDEDRATMVAEIKIMAGHFTHARKCLVGSGPAAAGFSLEPGPDGRRLVTRDEITGAMSWGLVSDAARLLRHPAKDRYLILVLLDLYEDVEDMAARLRTKNRALHAAMEGIRFSGDDRDEVTRRFPGFTVRIWRLTA